MKNICLLFSLAITLIGCQNDYYYLSETDFDGVEIESNNNVYKMSLKVKAEATCSSKIVVRANKYEYAFTLNSNLDTLITRDWYGDPMRVTVELDSCISGLPQIGIRLIE